MLHQEKARILIVEDNPTNARMLARGLCDTYQISLAASGMEALDMAARAETRPDLILLDVNLPELSGDRVCAALKDDPELRGIPVIFITARNCEEDEQQALALGAADYITKPYSLPMVRLRVRTHLELKNHRAYFENLGGSDGLTGMAGRRRFEETAALEWRRCCRAGDHLTLLMLHLDHFDRFCNGYGHAAGDQCLCRIARTLHGACRRAGDLIARFQGGTFGALLPQTDGVSGLETARRIESGIMALNIVNQYSPHEQVTVSIGLAACRVTRNSTFEQLYEAAREAMEQARKAGGNRLISAPTHDAGEVSSPGVPAHLRAAIAARHLDEIAWQQLEQLTAGLEDADLPQP